MLQASAAVHQSVIFVTSGLGTPSTVLFTTGSAHSAIRFSHGANQLEVPYMVMNYLYGHKLPGSLEEVF